MSAEQLNVNLDKIDSQMGELLTYALSNLPAITQTFVPSPLNPLK